MMIGGNIRPAFSTLYKRGDRPFLTEIPKIPSLKIPEHIVIVNAGASITLSALENMEKDFEKKNDTSKYPKKITFILTPALTTENCNNKFIESPFGQPVFQLPEKSILYKKGLHSLQRPPIKVHFSGVKELIYQKSSELSEKYPDTEINIHELEKDDVLQYYPDDRSFRLSNPSKGPYMLIEASAETSQDFLIIDAARAYGKVTKGELPLSKDEVIKNQFRMNTLPATDLYQMSNSEIQSSFQEATSTGRHVAILGAGLTAVWMMPIILEYGFIPVIINTGPIGVDLVSLMKYANDWIVTDLCEKLECTHEELSKKISRMIINVADISDEMVCSVNGEQIIINKFYDATGYCEDVSFLKDIPFGFAIDPYISVKIFTDYIRTIMEKGLHELDNHDDLKARELIEHAYSRDVKEILNTYKTVSRRVLEGVFSDDAIPYQAESNEISNIDQLLARMKTQKISSKKEDVETALRALKILTICTTLEKIKKDLDQNTDSKRGYNLLKQYQELFKILKKEIKNPISTQIADQLKIKIDHSSIDGEKYIYHRHVPVGSATGL